MFDKVLDMSFNNMKRMSGDAFLEINKENDQSKNSVIISQQTSI